MKNWDDVSAQMQLNGTPLSALGYCRIAFDEGLAEYGLLKAAFEANADETIALRKRFEDLWQVKTDLENDVARLKKESDQILNDAIANIDRKANKITELTGTLAAVMAPEWRDVGTLPKIDPDTCQSNNLLGVWPNGSMMVIYLDVCSGWKDAESGDVLFTMPTHWMPLPEPPLAESV